MQKNSITSSSQNDTTICVNCRETVTYTVKEQLDSFNYHGKQYIYTGKFAYCNKCGQEVWVEELEDYNLKESLRLVKQ